MNTGSDISALSDNMRRMTRENLVSFVIISGGATDKDAQELQTLWAWVSPLFRNFEILVVSKQAPPGWQTALRAAAEGLVHVRVLTLQYLNGFDDVANHAMDHAIGDYVVILGADEVHISEVEKLLEQLAEGQADILTARHATTLQSKADQILSKVIITASRLLTGYKIIGHPVRLVGLNRTAITRVLAHQGPLRYFRLLDLSDQTSQDIMEVERKADRGFFTSLSGKLTILADIVSETSGRVVRLLAVTCFVLSSISLLVALASVAIWFLKTDIAEGWTSLTVVFSGLFSANFAVLGAICLGLQQLLRQNRPEDVGTLVAEFTSADLRPRAADRNVELTVED